MGHYHMFLRVVGTPLYSDRMTSSAPAALGMCFDRTFDPALITDFARALDARAEQLWVIEDCFYTGGISLAAAALAVTEELTVGLGILPARARTAAITAMEIATLCGLAPGRVLPGIGHGVQDWMAQMGVRPQSPVTALDEVLSSVGPLLDGEQVSTDGPYVYLDHVQLDQPPVPRPPVLAGVRGPNSLALAGRVADGVVLDMAGPAYVRRAIKQADPPGPFRVVTVTAFVTADRRMDAYRSAAPWLAGQLESPSASIRAVPFFDELMAVFQRDGPDGLASIPADWWSELGAIGTLDDAMSHVEALEAAGVDDIAMFPAPDPAIARAQLDDVVRLASAREVSPRVGRV